MTERTRVIPCNTCRGSGKVAVVEPLCNKCGNTCLKYYPEGDTDGCWYGLDASFHGGYLSEKFNDGTEYKFRMCEDCLSEVINVNVAR